MRVSTGRHFSTTSHIPNSSRKSNSSSTAWLRSVSWLMRISHIILPLPCQAEHVQADTQVNALLPPPAHGVHLAEPMLARGKRVVNGLFVGVLQGVSVDPHAMSAHDFEAPADDGVSLRVHTGIVDAGVEADTDGHSSQGEFAREQMRVAVTVPKVAATGVVEILPVHEHHDAEHVRSFGHRRASILARTHE